MRTYQVVRYGFGKDSTLGFWTRIVDGDATQLCFNVEDERRNTKVQGETCIPVGTYELRLRTEGGMHARYTERFGSRHKGMLELQNVENFEFVYVHIGNDDDDTRGCLLPGMVPGFNPDKPMEFVVGRSTEAYWMLYEEIVPLLIAGERVVLQVTEIQPWA